MQILNDILASSNTNAKTKIAKISDSLLNIADIKPLKSIPIFSTLCSAIDLVSTIRNRFLFQKIKLFINQLNEYDDGTRQKFFATVNNIAGGEENLGEYVLVYLDSIIDKIKAIYFGRIFNAFVLGQISYEEFELSSAAIENIRSKYFEFLTKPPVELRILASQVKNILFEHFLLEIVVNLIDPNLPEFSGSLYKISKFGVTFAKYALNVQLSYREYKDIKEYYEEIGYIKAQKDRYASLENQSNHSNL